MTQQETPSPAEQDGPFAELLGIRPGQSADGVGTAFMTVADKHRQRAGAVQGGILVALADYAFFRACRSVLKEGEHAVTIELKLNFIAPAREGDSYGPQRYQEPGRSHHSCGYGNHGTGRQSHRHGSRNLHDGVRPARESKDGLSAKVFSKSRMAAFHLEPSFRRKPESRTFRHNGLRDSHLRGNDGLTLKRPC